jgi:membrane-associated phospholipid phosphatase
MIIRRTRGAAVLAIAFLLGVTGAARAAPATALAPPTPASAPQSQPRDPGWWHWSYLIDWGLMVGVVGASAGIYNAKPHERSFTLDTPRIDHAHREETAPGIWLILTVALPLATFGIAQAGGPSWHDFHHATLGMGEALGVAMLITGVLKVSIGRLRPDFLARCQPDANLHCTGDPDEVRQGRLSFPSGHSSLSFAAGTYMSLYLWGKLSPLKGLHWLWKVPTLLLPMASATFMAWSRVHDHRHHWEDVLGSSLIGFGSAVLGYLLNYHLPWSKDAGKPRRRKQLTVVPVAGTDRVGLAVQGGF